ncbi:MULTISPECIES: hypothetical protein [Shewanella]|uniref:PH domain-containing protein n=1 Tax=Shewanella cutis TaxID=2766780 RepID=A0ABS9QPZ7_9GAMM|nr:MULTISPECIES: hypothetical protein [Shewanella]ASF13867.1 hypothetical protein CEQ32_01650 [Shewanella sp. FDAARGOS_354]MCG9962426.1 hypothetical protein [Shewanella sp. PS-2]MEE1979256.1 hypothetical protein [Shewanella xiamenensis]
MMSYSNSQIGYPFFIICFFTLIFVFAVNKFGLQEFKGENDFIMLILILSVALLMTFRLRVSIEDKQLTLSYGIGLFKKRFDLSDVNNVSIVRNKWYCGWGVRISSEGTIYNISGFEGVKIDFRSGVSIVVGTNKPLELYQALKKFTS